MKHQREKLRLYIGFGAIFIELWAVYFECSMVCIGPLLAYYGHEPGGLSPVQVLSQTWIWMEAIYLVLLTFLTFSSRLMNRRILMWPAAIYVAVTGATRLYNGVIASTARTIVVTLGGVPEFYTQIGAGILSLILVLLAWKALRSG